MKPSNNINLEHLESLSVNESLSSIQSVKLQHFLKALRLKEIKNVAQAYGGEISNQVTAQSLITFLCTADLDNESSLIQIIHSREKRARIRAVGFEIFQYLLEKTSFPQMHYYILRSLPANYLISYSQYEVCCE